MNELDYKLCYVDECWAWFTTDFENQWGDDWNDRPYEHNAEEPSPWHERMDRPEYFLRKLAFEGDFERPCDFCQNSPYSVEDINKGAVAWLRSSQYVAPQVIIPAGTLMPDFCNLVQKAGGTIYLPFHADEFFNNKYA